CVIVCDGEIIGEGFHEKYGEAHAEVNAIAAVKDQSILSKSTAYIILEPCAHHGKTPPCANLLIEKGLKRVIIGCRDPFVEVNGKGIERLQEAGVEVVVGVLECECRNLNKRFFTYIERKRPFVILKWAQTNDGFIARENLDLKWISNQYSLQLVHKWRSEEAAILVGKNTALHDNPSLTVREWKGKNPVRIVIDNRLELPRELNLFDGSVPTMVLNLEKEERSDGVHYVKYDGSMNNLLDKLYEQKIQSVIVEGGAKVLNNFIESELWDEARVFSSKKEFGEGIESPPIGGRLLEDRKVMGDRLEVFEYVH
ncbi:MAG: bifunctional diaminohydroxyphosphoribosylaminopyrimidine deaminase/5-amino-6-(5-phosphoribosylamino)uracil reductase RibD, partial [Cytophagales bacterium]|nr:bifunctional diaminohydroxyphosphoribosylaminopyrimidine deaminase/5-amino-6-(5-phosphoribosylamino)uracil reductase RibD [Cytophagales bacterium]